MYSYGILTIVSVSIAVLIAYEIFDEFIMLIYVLL